MKRARMKSAVLLARPAPAAVSAKMTALTIMTMRRPWRSAMRPARRAPIAQPIRMDATAKPVPALVEP
jgi:hypothetical protein